jgi:hypothetical protein
MSTVSAPQKIPEDFSVQEAARDQVEHWSYVCQKFLDWQKREVLRKPAPSAKTMEEHRSGLKWLIRFGRVIQITLADPDYPDKHLLNELEGRLAQLEESWKMVYEPMPDGQAAKLLKETFPEEQEFIAKLFSE